jgi:thioredoxin reductase (NADPH)
MSLIETRRHQMFPVLSAAQIEISRRFASGAPQRFEPSAVMYDVGDRGSPV